MNITETNYLHLNDMKKVVLSLIFLMLAIGVNAQNAKKNGEPYLFYCQYVGELQSSGRTKPIKFIWPNLKESTKLTDERGNVIEFYRMIDVVNYMAKGGWTLDSFQYYYSSIVYYIFKKTVTNDEEAKESLHFKSDFE